MTPHLFMPMNLAKMKVTAGGTVVHICTYSVHGPIVACYIPRVKYISLHVHYSLIVAWSAHISDSISYVFMKGQM